VSSVAKILKAIVQDRGKTFDVPKVGKDKEKMSVFLCE
jgi:hypothetical protein